MVTWVDIFFRLLFKVIVFISCLFIAFSAVVLFFDICVRFDNWVKESVIPFFKELEDTIHDITQLEWDIVYKETKRKIKKWWDDYSVEIITIGVGAIITIALAVTLYHNAMHWISLIK